MPPDLSSVTFQFTPLREGRLAWMGEEALENLISIHAPPRGATALSEKAGISKTFQFTPLREGRRWRPRSRSQADRISIHAPPRGATSAGITARLSTRFQFTPLREGRRIARFCCEKLKEFQFTPLREGRHEQRRTRAATTTISIHAPPRGAT